MSEREGMKRKGMRVARPQRDVRVPAFREIGRCIGWSMKKMGSLVAFSRACRRLGRISFLAEPQPASPF